MRAFFSIFAKFVWASAINFTLSFSFTCLAMNDFNCRGLCTWCERSSLTFACLGEGLTVHILTLNGREGTGTNTGAWRLSW